MPDPRSDWLNLQAAVPYCHAPSRPLPARPARASLLALLVLGVMLRPALGLVAEVHAAEHAIAASFANSELHHDSDHGHSRGSDHDEQPAGEPDPEGLSPLSTQSGIHFANLRTVCQALST